MPTSSLRPLKPPAFDYWAAQHLLNRAGFGGTPAQVRALADLGLDAAVDHIIDYREIPTDPVTPDAFDGEIMRPPTEREQVAMRQARRNGDEAAIEQARREQQARQRADRRQIAEMQTWWLRRLVETPRPLEEKLTLFWHGHFATGYRTIENSYHMFLQNQMFRHHATGSFKDLAFGIIRDPAMIRYLNNNQNRRERPNENLARELMELFTLGEGHAYTERDIKEGARALTGYTYVHNDFVFREEQHDPEPKRILGRVASSGEDFVSIILGRPEVSQFISWKLYRYFVNDMPGDPDRDSQQFILQLAKLFRQKDYELRPLLRTLFKSEHFYDDANRASLIKNPIQLIVQAVRSLHTPTRSLAGLISAGDLMGQDLFFPPSVKGWDGGRAWINTSTMFVRQNALVYLLTGQRPDAYPWQTDGATYDAMHLIEHLDPGDGEIDVTAAVTYLLRFNLGFEPDPSRVRTLVQFVQAHGGRLSTRTRQTNDLVIALLSLITAMPEYQLC
ncbi:MAG: DUF1800 domain-containing protein [Phycisphaerales bacterium]|nr:DUF1800 domain-containing protein [Phycisphaerales bacterium]